MPNTYKIVRFYADERPKEVINTGFTLHQAQTHCNDAATTGEGWFDGYEDEGYDAIATKRAVQEAHQSWVESL